MSGIQLVLHSPVAARFGLCLVHFLWQGAALALLAVLLLALLRRASPGPRYLALLLVFAAMALAPVVTYAVTSTAAPPAAPFAAHGLGLGSGAPGAFSAPAPPAGAGLLPAVAQPQQAEPLLDRASSWVRGHLAAIAAAWLIGVLVLSLRLLAGWLGLLRLHRRASDLSGGRWPGLVASLSQRLRLARPIRVLESPLAVVPTVAGWVRPVILLPATALTGLSADQLEAVIAHELAHIRRCDHLANLAQTVLEVLLFYHPAVWWLSARLREEREHCCDDLAVASCGDALTYARALAALEQLRIPSPRPALAATAGPLLSRIRRLVGASSHRDRTAAWLAGALLIAALATLGLAISASAGRGPANITPPALGQPPIPIEGLVLVSGASGPISDGAESPYYSYFLSGTSHQVTPAGVFARGDISFLADHVLYERRTGKPHNHTVEIWRADLDGANAVNLSQAAGLTGINCWPRWSPDGTALAFQHCDAVADRLPCTVGFHVWIMHADGRNAHPVFADNQERSSADEPAAGGRRPAPDRSTPEVSFAREPAWSPDGSRLLCDRYLPDWQRIVVDLATGDVKVLPGVGIGADWSPDGSTIISSVFDQDIVEGEAGTWRRLLLTDANGENPRVVVEQFISDADLQRHVAALGLPGDAFDYITSARVWVGPTYPKWSPTGDQIAFIGALPFDPEGPHFGSQAEVWIYDFPADQITRITADLDYDLSLSWRPAPAQ